MTIFYSITKDKKVLQTWISKADIVKELEEVVAQTEDYEIASRLSNIIHVLTTCEITP